MQIVSDGLIKNALMLWDHVDLITPFNGLPYFEEGPRGDALKEIARALKPSRSEQEQAHEVIMDLVDSTPAGKLRWPVEQRSEHSVWPQKFLPQTWDELIARDLVTPHYIRGRAGRQEHRRFKMERRLGVLIMYVLADCCAGNTRELVTDEPGAHQAHERYLKLISGATPVRSACHERLATLSLMALDLSRVSLGALVRVRKAEASNPALRAMRHSYVRKLDAYVQRLKGEARKVRDVEEIERLFQQEVRDDIGLLKDELGAEAKKVVFSKEFTAAVVLLAGAFIEPITGTLGAASVLYKVKTDYKAARNKTLVGHPMSWLYQLKTPHII